MESEITMTSGLATGLFVLCLGLLFYRDNNSTSGIVMRFSDLIYLQKKKMLLLLYNSSSNCAIARCMSLTTIPFSSHAVFSRKPYLAFLFWVPKVLSFLQIAVFKNSMIIHKNVNFWFLS